MIGNSGARVILHFGAADARHVHIKQYATRLIPAWQMSKQLRRRVIKRHLVTGHPQQATDRGAEFQVIVNHVNGRHRDASTPTCDTGSNALAPTSTSTPMGGPRSAFTTERMLEKTR